MRPPQFVDPRDVKPLLLDRAAVEALVGSGFAVAPRSVLADLLASDEAPTDAQREAAGKELGRRGVLVGAGARPSPEGALLLRSLEIVAQPEAEVRVESTTRGSEGPEVSETAYFLQGDGAAPVAFRPAALEVRAALRADALAAQLSKLFQPGPQPRDFAPVALARSQVEAATLVFGEGADASGSLTRDEALANLKKAGVDGADAAALVDVLVATGVLEDAGGALSIVPALRAALAAVWSGESHQLVVRDLDDDARDEDPEGVGLASFLVVGRAGRRVILDASEALDGESVEEAPADPDEALDTEVLQFSWLTREEMDQSLAVLLALDPG